MPDIDIIIKAQDRASGPIKNVDNALDKLNKNAGNVAAKGIGDLRNALGVGIKVAAAAAVVAIGALGVALGKSVKSAMDMEQAVADIMAVMGKTAPPVKELNDAILELGLDPKLKVSAFEAADAIEMLSKNGVSWQAIQEGMARSTILLANATNDDFALAADVATDAMVQFNKDASEMADVVDGIIGVTQQSKFDINDYALALAQAGGVAGSVGVDFDDFNAMLAATSSSFASGSDAGTSFKVFLQQLIPDTNKSADAMRDLGLFSGLTGAEFDKVQEKIGKTQAQIAALDPTSKNYGERLQELNIKLTEQRAALVAGGSAFFDANGSMKSAEEITAALSEAFTGLSDAERISAASTIFGTDAMRTALALADAGEDTIHKFKVAIGDTSAEDASATRMNTLRGAWEIFLGVTETLSIQLGQTFLPIARDVVEWATQLATAQGPKVIEWFAGLTTSAGTFIAKLREGKDPLTAFREAFVNFIPAATMTAIDKVIGQIQSVIDWVGKTIGPFISWDDVLKGLALTVGVVAVSAIGGFLVAIAPAAAVVGGITLAVALLGDAFAPLLTTITTFGGDALREIVTWASGNETEFTNTKKIWESLGATVVEVGDNIKKAFFAPDGAGTHMAKWLKAEFPAAAAASIFASNELKAAFTDLIKTTDSSLGLSKAQMDSFLMGLQDIFGKGLAVIITRITTFVANFGDLLELMDAAGRGNFADMWEAIKATQDRATRTQLFETLVWSGDMEAAFMIAGQGSAQGYSDGIERNKHYARGAVFGMANEIKGEFENSLDLHSPSGVFRGYGTNTVQGFIDGVSSLIGAVGSKMGEVISAIKSGFGDTSQWLRSAGTNAVQGFIDGVGSLIGAAQSKVTELANLAAQAATAALGIGSPSKVFMGIGQNVAAGFGLGVEQGMGKLSPTFNSLSTWVPSAAATSNSTSINNSRTSSNQMIVQVQSTGDAVRDIRNQVELYNLSFGAT